jgi:transketolase
MSTPASEEEVGHLADTARAVRREIVRMAFRAGGHPTGASLAATDLLTALVFRELRLDPTRPNWPDRDRLVLSYGAASSALYAALAHRGYLPVAELESFGRSGARLPIEVDRLDLPGIEATPGAPGVGLGLAVGLALDQQLRGTEARTVVLVGDEELGDGSSWDALGIAGAQKIPGFTVVVSASHHHAGGGLPSSAERLAERCRSLGFIPRSCDGHDLRAIVATFDELRSVRDRPAAVIARTVDGRGVSFLEARHGRSDRLHARDEAGRAMAELGGALE